MLKLYMTPGSCSTGIHILLEELALVFEVQLVNLLAGDQDSASFRALNPKGTIPVLVTERGSAITEFSAIALWLARTHPEARLLPADLLDEARALEFMTYAVYHLHGQAFARIFTAETFAVDGCDLEAVRERGRQMVAEGMALVDARLPEDGYALGDFSIADAALFYVEFWATRTDIALPPRCAAHYRRMLSRAPVRQVLMEEGYRVE